jgi:hypothetical protein
MATLARSGVLLAEATKPSGGSRRCGRSRQLTIWSQCLIALAFSIMSCGTTLGRLGSCAAIAWPICPRASAKTMFCAGMAKPSSADRNSSQDRARPTASSALSSSVA